MSPRASNALRLAGWIALALALAWSAHLRVELIAAGPDPDTDVYRHVIAARRMADDWGNVRVHWVWLPLWHVVHWVALRVGSDFNGVRYFSVACSALTCVALTLFLRDHLRRNPAEEPWLRDVEEVVPFASGVLLALWPQNLTVGASAEPEAFFQLLVLASVVAWERRFPVLAGVALALAALLRYEAWPLPVVFLWLWWRGERSARAAMAWVLPGVAVCAWCALHARLSGEWFWFLKENRRYIQSAWRQVHLADRLHAKPPVSLFWYAAGVPFRSVGALLVAAVPGAVWLWRRGPRAFALMSAVALGVVTAVWVARANLGLTRHFAVLLPAYAALVASGVCVGAAWVARRLAKGAHREWIPLAASCCAFALALGGPVEFRVRREMRHARAFEERVVASERRVARFVRENIPPRAKLFTDLVAVEVFSGVAPERVARWRPSDVHDYNLLVEAAQRGEVWVAAPVDQVTHLREDVETVFRDGTLVVLRRRAPRVIDPALLRAPSAR